MNLTLFMCLLRQGAVGGVAAWATDARENKENPHRRDVGGGSLERKGCREA